MAREAELSDENGKEEVEAEQGVREHASCDVARGGDWWARRSSAPRRCAVHARAAGVDRSQKREVL